MPNEFVMEGIMGGFERASETLLNVSLKKQQLEQEKKSDDLNYKIKNLQLEKLKGEMDPQLWAMQNKELKDEIKAKKAYRDFTMSYLDRVGVMAKSQSDKLDSYAKGLTDSYNADGYQRQGFNLAGMELDLEAGLGGEFPLKQTTPSDVLKRDKAEEELIKRAGARQPLDTKVLPPKKGFLGFGEGNVKTVEFAKTIQTRQDLINMIKNADALEEQGIDINQIEDLYEDELLRLAQEGYLSEK